METCSNAAWTICSHDLYVTANSSTFVLSKLKKAGTFEGFVRFENERLPTLDINTNTSRTWLISFEHKLEPCHSIIHHLHQEGILQRCPSQVLVSAFFAEVACVHTSLQNYRPILDHNCQIPNLSNPLCRLPIAHPAQVQS